jgi:prepilin-type N-terminal cleavage/methylation domain-containing protein/prepilin-type processing-associated H-X9-DG protein
MGSEEMMVEEEAIGCSRQRRGLTLLETLVVIAIIGVFIGLLLPAVQRVRDTVLRTRCLHQLRQIGLALHQYHDAQGSLPPGVSYHDGTDPQPFLSWNSRILPFLEQQVLWERTQQAFAKDKSFLHNPPHTNRTVVMPLFSCPADPRTLSVEQLADGQRVTFTDYLGVEGTTLFRGDGVLFVDSHVRLTDIADGASNTLCVGERPPSADGIFGWWYAGEGQNKTGSGDMVLGVREYNTGQYSRDCPLGPYSFGPGRPQNQCDAFHFWSLHIGGAHFLFADGSVHFLSYSSASVLPALATRGGGEPSPSFD